MNSNSPEPKAEPAEPLQGGAPASLITPGAFQSPPAAIIEMENWEVAPGTIVETGGNNPEPIAFSKPYLSGKKPVQVGEDVTFRVDTIRPGQAWHLVVDKLKTRICSLAAGKVRVKIGNEPEFVIGPHGAFRVKAGTTCTLENSMYSDAVLHITGIADFDI